MSFTGYQIDITDITQAIPAVVTTAVDHGLATGNIVRVIVPKRYGMVELNKLVASITVLSATTFSLQYPEVPHYNVDSRNFTTFVIPSLPQMVAQILPMGAWATKIAKVPWQINEDYYESLTNDEVYNNSTTEIPF